MNWRETRRSGTSEARKEIAIYLEGATTHGRVTKLDEGVWRADVRSDFSYWFCEGDAIHAVKVKLATALLAN